MMAKLMQAVGGQLTEPKAERLEEVLEELRRHGKPRVGIYGSDGLWHCSLEMHVEAVGASFDIRSDYKHATPMEAAVECRKRMGEAIAKLTGGVK